MTTIERLASDTGDDRLKRLLSYLSADPSNDAIRVDAAEQALSAGAPELVIELLGGKREDRLGNRELNLVGLAYLQGQDFLKAAQIFTALIGNGVDQSAVTFNLAWSLAMEKQFQRALELLSDTITSELPDAAMLQVQLLHELGDFEGAAIAARRHISAYPNHGGIAAAVSVLALDIEDLELARTSAEQAGSHPDAAATLGTLALGEQQIEQALQFFDAALQMNKKTPRAWIGRGLARLVTRDEGAAADIDRGAELFGDHIGSWIAAGWAYLIAGELDAATQRFKRALAIDENFAESHGSLAVVDALEGREGQARNSVAIAKRLDRECFSAAFAQSLLAERGGKAEAGRALFEKILQTPVNARGDTAAIALARMGFR